MKTITVLFALFLSMNFYAQTEGGSNVTVKIENIKNDEGSVLFGLYTQNTFLKAKPEFTAKSEIVNGVAQITFENVPEGTYAITCFHDMNGNDQMDFEPSGMPKEDYAVSNNAVNMYGPPEWTDAKFEVNGTDINMDLSLNN